MNKQNWKDFLLSAGARALRSFCQSVVILMGTDAVSIIELDWARIIGVSAGYALASFLTSVALGLPEVDDVKIHDLTTKQ